MTQLLSGSLAIGLLVGGILAVMIDNPFDTKQRSVSHSILPLHDKADPADVLPLQGVG
jgi:hypothetical protein